MSTPSVETVAAHAAAHPDHHVGQMTVYDKADPRNETPVGPGGRWIAQDPARGGAPTFLTLAVAQDRVWVNNGLSFWQPLDGCAWADRSTYRPVDANGFAVVPPQAGNLIQEAHARCTDPPGTNDRWERGCPHHPAASAIFALILESDWRYGADTACWKHGGDGDAGEDLMFALSALLEAEPARLAPLRELLNGRTEEKKA